MKVAPAVVEAGALTPKCVAAAGLTPIGLPVPVMLLLLVSVAVSVWFPAVLSVAVKVPTPLLSVLLPGRAAWPSLLVKWTVPP